MMENSARPSDLLLKPLIEAIF